MNSFELGTDGPQVILVGVDDSITSLRAAAYAAGLARRQSARLFVVYVRSASTMAALAPLGAASMRQALDETSEDLRRRVVEGSQVIGIGIEFVTADGEPFAELVRVADENPGRRRRSWGLDPGWSPGDWVDCSAPRTGRAVAGDRCPVAIHETAGRGRRRRPPRLEPHTSVTGNLEPFGSF